MAAFVVVVVVVSLFEIGNSTFPTAASRHDAILTDSFVNHLIMRSVGVFRGGTEGQHPLCHLI